MRVFVLNTGRCGSVTFARACQASVENYTAGHETRISVGTETRLDYPDQHIECDNRLSFFLGGLAIRYPTDVYYVHLRRDPEAVARSFLARWTKRGLTRLPRSIKQAIRAPYSRSGAIIEAFSSGVLLDSSKWNSEAERLAACRLYVRSTNENIAHFLVDKPHMDIDIETATRVFPQFCERIGATFDRDVAKRELTTKYNARPQNTRLG